MAKVYAFVFWLLSSILCAQVGPIFPGPGTPALARTPAVVQSAKNTGTGVSTLSKAFASDNTAGDLIVISIGAWSGSSAPTINTPTDSQGNTYTLVTGTSGGGHNSSASMYYAKNIAGGANTVTATSSLTGDIDIVIIEYSGMDTVSPLDQVGTGNNLSGVSTITTNSITTTVAKEVIVAYAYDQSASHTWTVTSGYTQEQNTQNPDGTASSLADQLVSSTGTYSVTFTIQGAGASNSLHAGIASFK